MNQEKILLKLKEKHGFKSWTQVADYLGVSKSAVSQWRSETTNFDADHAKQLAEELGIDKSSMALAVMAARAKSASTRKYWEAAAVVAFALPGLQISGLLSGLYNQLCILC